MESRYPLLNCPLQLKLKRLCCSDPSNPSKWVYAVFWSVLPRIYPPPKWDHGGITLDRAKGNIRNWILVWEDGFCDFHECASGRNGGGFGPQLYFKMTHEVYSYGEGMVGKVAAENSHRWVFKPTKDEKENDCISSWSSSFDTHPKTWKLQFNSGIQTIAVVSVREGVVQLGSFDKMKEDPNWAMEIQRKFSHVTTIQRPMFQSTCVQASEQHHISGMKRPFDEIFIDMPRRFNVGCVGPQNGNLCSSISSMAPPCNLGSFLSISHTQHEDGLGSGSRAIRARAHGYGKAEGELTWELHLDRGNSG